MVVAPDPDDPERYRALAVTKSNYATPPRTLRYELVEGDHGVVRVEWRGELGCGADALRPRERPSSKDRAEDVLAELLGEGPRASESVKAEANLQGVKERTLWRAKAALGVTAKSIDGISHWGFPDQFSDL